MRIVLHGIRPYRDKISLLCLLVLILFASPAWALDPSKKLSQYGHTAWRLQDGYFTGTPFAISQTTDGYLWLGTESGLWRFDGVSFTRWNLPAGKPFDSGVTSLLGSRDGGLWIGTTNGLMRWKDGTVTTYSDAPGVVVPILERKNGEIWFGRRYVFEAPTLCQVLGKRAKCYGKENSFPFQDPAALIEDSADNLWIGTADGLVRWQHGSPTYYGPAELKGSRAQGVSALALAQDGSLWVGISTHAPNLGLQRFANNAWTPFLTPHMESTMPVNTLFVDRHKNLWIGTHAQGIVRIIGDRVDQFRRSDGLSSDMVLASFEDREGNVWVATARGLDCFRDLSVTTFTSREGLAMEEVDAVLASRNGTVLVSGANAFQVVSPESSFSISPSPKIPGSQVTALLEDHAGRLWMGLDRSLAMYENRTFRRIDRRDGTPLGFVVGMTEDVDHDIWVETSGTPRTLFRIRAFQVQEEFPAPKMPAARMLAADPKNGIWLGLITGDLARYSHGKLEIFPFKQSTTPNAESLVNHVVVNPDGSVLGATFFGVIAWKNGRQQTLTARNGLPCNNIHAVVMDNHDNFWLYAQCGLISIEDVELQKWWARPDTVLQVKVLDALDGAQPGRTPFNPSAKSLDGKLWFANNVSLQMVDPDVMSRKSPPPPPHVEELVANGQRYPVEGKVSLPPVIRNLEIAYTAPAFAAPQKVRFRYRLEAHDRDWQDAGGRRQAFYNDLAPGDYRFRVMARMSDSPWNEAGVVDFRILPAWYQTALFRGSCAAVVLLMIWGLYRYRLHQLSREFNLRLDERVGERTRIARELHDTLLQSFHGLLPRFQAAHNLLPGRAQDAGQVLQAALDDAAQAITEARDAVQDLRSSTSVTNDLAKSIEVLGEELRARQGADCGGATHFSVQVEGTPQDLHSILRDEIYRITGEALRNAFQHAKARRIEAEIRYDARQLRVRVRDDGIGIDPSVLNQEGSPGHFGLRGMRERSKGIGGQLAVWSERRAGTELELTVPASVAYGGHLSRRFRFAKSRRTNS